LQPAAPGHTSTWRLTLLHSDTPPNLATTNGNQHSHGDADPDRLTPNGTVDLADVNDFDEDDPDDDDEFGRQPRHPAGHSDEESTRTGGPRWRLDPLGLILTPPTLAAAELDALCTLLADVARPPIPAAPPAPSPTPGVPPVTDVRPLPPLPPGTPASGRSRADTGWIPDIPTWRPPAPAATATPASATVFPIWTPPATAAPADPPGDEPSTTSAATTDLPVPAAPAPEASLPASPSEPAGTLNGHTPARPASGDTPATPDSQTAMGPPPYVEPDWQIMIHLYGPADATNRAGTHPTPDLARGRTLEILAWLATHPGRTRTNLETAIWPDDKLLARSVNNQLGRARRLLVQLAGGHARAWIPTGQTRLHLHPAVTTDLDLLTHRLDYARRHRAHPKAAIPVLTDALDLITGTPALYEWIDAELGSILTTTAVRAAILLADLHLETGNPAAALDATTRGLEILPAHPELFALRLRAHHTAGDQLALTADYHAYLRTEQADPTWDGETNPDLAYLHRILTRKTAPKNDTRAR
ncbi:bacterial transcriptional activator domain-containing protein, partial [Frankia sp. CNm7]